MAGSSHNITSLYSCFTPLTDKEWATVMLDFEKYANHHVIVDKNGNAVKMKLNNAQKVVAELILKYAMAEIPRPIKLVIHKCRQAGISTVLSLIEKYIASRKTKINILHMLPTEELARNFWREKGEPLWQGSDPALLPTVQATGTPTPYIQVKEYHNVQMGVNIRYNGSNSKSAMRSSTNQVVILDEEAFFENVRRLEKGVLATQPKTGMAITVYVSTANGMNHFYDAVKQAQTPNSGMEYIFLPWHMLDEYERPISKESRFYDLEHYKPSAFDMKMFDIFEKAGYPKSHWLNKLEWYDHVLASEAKGDRDYMASEYPSTPEESFRASGRPVLPLKVINYWLKQNHPYTAIAPVAKTDRNSRTLKVKFEEDSNSPVRRYLEPIAGHRYMIGVDCAEGYSGDMSAGVIFDIKTLEEVASFVVDYEQNDLAELVVDLAKYYNNAQIVPEKNMAGLFVESVQLLGYWNMFIDPEYHGPQTNKMYGIRTTLASKNEAINRLKFLMNQNLYKAHDLVFMNQAIHYSWKQLPSGGAKAEAVGQDDNGNPWHDDTIACRLTLMLALDFRRFKQYFKK
nr:MAG TPA: Terminase large subunit [Caudoviricetes sp.]